MTIDKVTSLLTRIARRVFYPLVPERRKLAFLYTLYMLSGKHEKELLNLDRVAKHLHTAIDVGANKGFYTLRMAELFDTVHSFEVNPEVTRLLKVHEGDNIHVHDVGLSNVNGTSTLYIPHVKGRELHGWASLTKGNCPDANSHSEKSVTISRLDRFHFRNVSFIKIDVEGHELQVLEGGMDTISRSRPVILCEVKRENKDNVFALLESMDYRAVTLDEITSSASDNPENVIFLPEG